MPESTGVAEMRADACRRAAGILTNMAAETKAALRDCSEDSYATRNELWRREAGLTQLSAAARHAGLTGEAADFGITIKDWGHDAEAAASDRMCGIEHVPQAERDADAHKALLGAAAEAAGLLRCAGVEVLEDIRWVEPTESEQGWDDDADGNGDWTEAEEAEAEAMNAGAATLNAGPRGWRALTASVLRRAADALSPRG